MKNNTNNTAKDVFSYLLMIITLYISVISILTILFQYINVLFPDKLDYYTRSLDLIRNFTSSLIIAWPVFILMSWLIGKDLAKNPLKKDIRIRRWLIYFTLFIAAITIIIDLIVVVNNFLGGELSIRFYLKVISVLLIAAGIIGYYLWDIKREFTKKHILPKILAWVLSAILLITIITGFLIIGSPFTQRGYRLDEERINNLANIQYEIFRYYDTNKKLPENLAQLSVQSGFVIPKDPESEKEYTYTVKTEKTFELCADFAQTSREDQNYRYYAPYEYGQNTWMHKAGTVCFERTATIQNNADNAPKPIPEAVR